MQIRRVILKQVRNFRDFDRSFEDGWTGRVPDALLLMGSNGSGKSTLLDAMAALWQGLADSLHGGNPLTDAVGSRLLQSADLAAMEVIGFEQESLWIYAGRQDPAREFAAAHANAHRFGLQYHYFLSPEELRGTHISGVYTPPGLPERDSEGGRKQAAIWTERLTDRLTENQLGKRADLPNLVYLASENRLLLPLTEKFSVQPEPEEYQWLARYEPVASRRGSLQNYLYNLKVVDEVRFNEIASQFSAFLVGKRLNGFDRRTGNLLVQVGNGESHPIEELSSGEKQVLLMLATITRWLWPGGIALVDEPDLHLHVSLARAFVSHLRRMVEEKGGQLIIASHMPELWEEFTDSHRVRLNASDEKGQTK
ncbi:MAG: AAA family ATPase [Chloroflexi bacterium]|nr:AAA family ATPase [Chloroflexota bacterium]